MKLGEGNEPVLTSSDGHEADGTHPTGTLSCCIVVAHTMDNIILTWLYSPVDVDPSVVLEGFTLSDIHLKNCSQNYTAGIKLISSNIFIFDSYAIICQPHMRSKVLMQLTSLTPLIEISVCIFSSGMAILH